ncbi:MAG: ABC transporter permease, partial [Acidobacteriaceae bacterium]|nr:ABC transporter permease [Acidobacteriaceae bacterium]
GIAFLVLFAIALHFQLQELDRRHVSSLIRASAPNTLLMMGLYAINLLVVVMSILTAVDTLSGEITSGTIQAVATKPVRRWELLAGKWLGFAGMLTLYIGMMVLGINALTYAISGVAVRHLLAGMGLIWLESLLLLSVTFFFGTMFSTLTNGVLALGLHGLAFLGGWVEQAGALTQTPKAVDLGIIASVVMPSEALWRRAAFEMQSPLATAVNFTPFSGASVPSMLMIIYAAGYMAVVLALAARRLGTRDL